MSYFDKINGFMDDIEQSQQAIENFKDNGFNSQVGDLQDKFSLIKQKALEGVPDIAGDVLNYTTQGVQALSGTYSTIRALKNSKFARNLAKKTGEPDKAPDEPADVDENGLPKLSDLEQRLNKLTRVEENPENVINENLTGGAYDDLARSKVQGNIEPNSAYNELRADREARGLGPEPEATPIRSAEEAPMVAREVDPVTGAEVRPPSPPKTRDLTDAEREIGADGFTPDERQAIETANDPAKLERNLQEENALDTAPEPKAPVGEAPFESLFPKPPQALTAGEKAAQYAKTTEEGGLPGGSSLLAKVTQQAGNDKPLVNPESNGVTVADELGEGASAVSKIEAAADIAEAPVALAGMVAGDIPGGQKVGEGINDAVGVKQAYNLGRRGKKLLQKDTGEADQATENPKNPTPDYEPLEEEPLDVDARIAQIRQKAQEAQEALPSEDDPALTPRLQALQAEEQDSPIRSADDTPTVEQGKIAPEVDTSAEDLSDKLAEGASKFQGSQLSEQGADLGEDVGKTLGERIAGTLGADTVTEGVLDALGPIGEIAGVGLMLGGIFHDIFGKKKQEREQAAQEQQAQNQEEQAEQQLKTQQSAGGVTTGAVDLASLHNIAGANASVGIV